MTKIADIQEHLNTEGLDFKDSFGWYAKTYDLLPKKDNTYKNTFLYLKGVFKFK